ncbi:MAG: [FeFe] hydrogenase H-cluster radical SAM maturase HydG [Candidatus Omnitrophica bacterium]|nr:[FeFe] hydrogenase H-cluster radical SAM maturase HydG [Candidatus Omnitrophota bacterium]
MDKTVKSKWIDQRIKRDEIEKYLIDGKNFISEENIIQSLEKARKRDSKYIQDILKKAQSIQNLTLEETAALLHVDDKNLIDQMKKVAIEIKKKVYNNRIVTFAPLYMGNYCVNNCLYCGFKSENTDAKRRVLSMEEIRKEVEVLAGKIGHKRLIVVYGEHPKNDIDYIVDSIKTVYDVKVPTKKGIGNIRRVNVNAPAFCIDDLKRLNQVGIGTYQVFQETYHRATYERVHPKGTIKGDYDWRLYCMHRAFEAGIDDVGLGALFGLYDWKFEVLGLVSHAIELERRFGIGPHTVSFPRLEPALGTSLCKDSSYLVSDEDFMKLILVVRLAIPFTGMIITARESPQIRKEAISLGVTQTDASTKIGIGGYADFDSGQEEKKQQFILGDTRNLDEVIREFAKMGYITSFCTAGYRCGRTGKCIMELLRSGQEGKFCKINAILTFKEWLDDFSSQETKKIAEPVLRKEIEEVRQSMPEIFDKFYSLYQRVEKGERDLYL